MVSSNRISFPSSPSPVPLTRPYVATNPIARPRCPAPYNRVEAHTYLLRYLPATYRCFFTGWGKRKVSSQSSHCLKSPRDLNFTQPSLAFRDRHPSTLAPARDQPWQAYQTAAK